MASVNVTRRGFFGNVAGAYATVSTIGAATLASASIEDMFQRWSNADLSPESYRALQERIVSAEPESAKDLAIQLFVETDGGQSEYRGQFFDKITTLVRA